MRNINRREFIKTTGIIASSLAIFPYLPSTKGTKHTKGFDKNAEYGNWIKHAGTFPDKFTIDILKQDANAQIPKGIFYEIRTKMPTDFGRNCGTSWYYAPPVKNDELIISRAMGRKQLIKVKVYGVEQKEYKGPIITNEFAHTRGYFLMGRYKSLG